MVEGCLILARIAAAEDLADNHFFKRLGKAMSRSVTPHRGAKRERAMKAASLLDVGLSWQGAYEKLELGPNPPTPTEFYKSLQRHGIIPRKQRKP